MLTIPGNLTALAHRVLLADPFVAALASDTNRVGRRCHPQGLGLDMLSVQRAQSITRYSATTKMHFLETLGVHASCGFAATTIW